MNNDKDFSNKEFFVLSFFSFFSKRKALKLAKNVPFQHSKENRDFTLAGVGEKPASVSATRIV